MNRPGAVTDEACGDFDFNADESVRLYDLARMPPIFGTRVGD